MDEVAAGCPDWNRLFETAAGQQGLFTTQQAAEAGYSRRRKPSMRSACEKLLTGR